MARASGVRPRRRGSALWCGSGQRCGAVSVFRVCSRAAPPGGAEWRTASRAWRERVCGVGSQTRGAREAKRSGDADGGRRRPAQRTPFPANDKPWPLDRSP
eukprot:6461912-Prymnesium_polylepis.1